jgi:hypothetical protein
VEAGKLKFPIDGLYPVWRIEAHERVERAHRKGNVVLTVGG